MNVENPRGSFGGGGESRKNERFRDIENPERFENDGFGEEGRKIRRVVFVRFGK